MLSVEDKILLENRRNVKDFFWLKDC